MKCAGVGTVSSLRRTCAFHAPRIRPLFPDWIRTCTAHLDGDRRGALGPNSPDFTGSTRQQLPKAAGPCGFMPRRQCMRRSPSSNEPGKRCTPCRGPIDIPRPRTSSTIEPESFASASLLSRSPPSIEATPATPADVPTFQRFGALRNPPVWERLQYRAGVKPVGLIFARALVFKGFAGKMRG